MDYMGTTTTTTSAAAALLHTLATTLTTSLIPGASADDGGGGGGGTATLLSLSTTTTTVPAALPPSGGGRPAPPDYLLHTQFVCDRVLVPLVVTFGLVGNVLSLAVLTRKEMASPTNCFLTALAISDLSLLLLQVPLLFGLSPGVAAAQGFALFLRYYIVIM